jgi:hypothetical protein
MTTEVEAPPKNRNEQVVVAELEVATEQRRHHRARP